MLYTKLLVEFDEQNLIVNISVITKKLPNGQKSNRITRNRRLNKANGSGISGT